MAVRWKSLAPSGFRFCMKAWQLITHTPSSPTYRRLASPVSRDEQELYGNFRTTEQVRLAWERTLEIADIIDARVIVFQCPKSFLPTAENIRNFNEFFHNIDRGRRLLAWEPRGDDWRPELVRELCAENDLVHCVDPFERAPVYGDSIYWRLHGRAGYRYRYTDEDLTELEAKLQAFKSMPGAHYIMFNNIYSREDAQRFLLRTIRRCR